MSMANISTESPHRENAGLTRACSRLAAKSSGGRLSERASFPARSSNSFFPELMLFLEDELSGCCIIQGLTRRSSGLGPWPTVETRGASFGQKGIRSQNGLMRKFISATTDRHDGTRVATCV